MSTEIGGRPVLRPAGNVALRHEGGDARGAIRKATKPPPSPVKPAPVARISPPNSQPSTPRTAAPQCRSPVLKPAVANSPSKLPPQSPRKPAIPNSPSKTSAQPGPAKVPVTQFAVAPGTADVDSSATNGNELPTPVSLDPASVVPRKAVPNSAGAPVSKSSHAGTAQGRKINPYVSLTRSSADVFQKGASNAKPKPRKNVSQLGSLSLDETSLANIVAAKKAAASELNAQRKLKVAEYGRKQGKASRVAPDVASLPPVAIEPKRCKFITAQSDPLYVAYHDEEWGVPVHDDRMLFELLVLAGAQVELSWTTILRKRDAYRSAFSGFDPVAVASFTEKQMQSLEADRSLSLAGAKIRGVVENAQRILEVVEEHGSLDKYFWGFLNLKPMINSYRYPKQVPVKTSKSESISKDLVRRGFRFVGPTIIYSFMQAAGMTNDHLMQCFRHQECSKLPSLLAQEEAQPTQQKPCFMQHYDGSEMFSLAQDEAQQKQGQEQCFLQHYEDSEIFLLAQEEALQNLEQEQCFLQHYDVSEIFSLVQEEAQPKQEQEQWFLQQYDDSEIFSLAQEEVQQKQGQEQCFLQPYDDSEIFSLPLDMDLEVQAEQEQDSNDQESQEQQEEEEQQQLEYCTYRRGQENQLSSDDETV